MRNYYKINIIFYNEYTVKFVIVVILELTLLILTPLYYIL